MSDIMLQAHRGVSADYPENTMSAFVGAIHQGYDIIELDLNITADEKIVVLHDDTINHTATMQNGKKIAEEIRICDITYEETQKYDFGQWFAIKYKNEKIPLLSEVLTLAAKSGVCVKIDNKFCRFGGKHQNMVFDMVRKSDAKVAFTVNSTDFAAVIAEKMPGCEIHYDGETTEEILNKLPCKNLTVWLKYGDFEKCRLVKKFARLGIWNVTKYEDFEKAVAAGADIVETNGKIKPVMRRGVIADVHIHSKYSHDSKCPIEDMQKSAKANRVDIICITDHCDICLCETVDVQAMTEKSLAASKNAEDIVKTYSGVEIGEAFWYPEVTEKILNLNGIDQAIGSVHAVRFPGYENPYSGIDFKKMGAGLTHKFLLTYFDDMLELVQTGNFDILAHLTCPLRYINGKYGMGFDCRSYEEKIRKILELVIKKGIVLEINTSCLGGNYDEYMPEEWIVSKYKEMGGHLVSLGSDAHVSENAGHDLKNAVSMLKKHGFKYICYFKDRFICQCTL